jgi:multiple sugar transport system substrate-binding protein
MKKFIALTLSVLMAASMLAACGSKTASSTAPASTAATSSSKAAEPVKLTWWAFPTFGTDGAYEQELITAYTAMHPEVTIELNTIDFKSGPEALTSAIEGGTAPDILFDAPGRIIEYGRAGKLATLDDMFTSDFVADVNNEQLLNACKADGTAYMYPLSSAPFYMGLDKEMLEKANALQYVNMEGDRTWTTDNFVKMCAALRDAGVAQTPGIVYCGAQGGDQGTRALVNNLYSSSIVGTDGKWNIDDKGIKALTLLQTMVSDKSLDAGLSYAAADELQQFQAETCAMTFCWGTSNAKNYASDTHTAISVPFPSDDGVPELEYLVNGFCVFNNGDDAKIAAAKDFIRFICDDATQGPKSVVKTGAFPVRTSFGNLYEGDAEMTLLASWTKYYGPYYNTKANFSVMRTEWWNMLQRIFQGGDVATEAKVYIENSNKTA